VNREVKDAGKVVAAFSQADYAALSPCLRPILERLLTLGYHIRDLKLDTLAENRFDVIVDQPIPKEMKELITLSEGAEYFDDSDEDGTPSIGFLCPLTYQTIIW
jgi:hypothetical protein